MAIYANKLDKVPDTPHWVILTERTHTSPGYDRDDPPYDTPYLEHTIFLTEDEFKEEMINLASRKGFAAKEFKGYFVPGVAKIKHTIEVF